MRRALGGIASALVLLAGLLGVVADLAASPRAGATPQGARFVSAPATRILDTRAGIGAPIAPVIDGGSLTLQIEGLGGVPSNALAVALNLTATNATGPGFVTAWPAGEPQPAVSNLNVETAGQTIANLAVVRLGADGQINLFAYAELDLVADLAGYWIPSGMTSSGRYVGGGPFRILDTREGMGALLGPVQGGTSIDLQVTGRGVLPDSGVAAAVLNVTTTNAERPGYVTAWPAGEPHPTTSAVNIEHAGQTISNLAIVPVGTGGRVSLFALSTMDLVVDVLGYFTDGTAEPSEDGLFVPASGSRILDTRIEDQNGVPEPFFSSPDRSLDLQVSGQAGVATEGVAAVIANVTATNATAPGFLTVWPAGTSQPLASNVNVDHVGQTIANLAFVPLGDLGRISIYSYSDLDVLVDVVGWFRGDSTPSDPGLPPDPPAPPTRTRVVWSMSDSALENIRDVSEAYAQAHFNNSATYITGPADDDTQYDVPPGWASVAVANYKSYALFEEHIANGGIDDRVHWVKYNPEKWELTPLNEQQDPYTYMDQFCSLAHTNGYSCIVAPARDLLLVDGAVCPKQSDENLNEAYLRCRVAEAAARNADHLGIQAQVNQANPAVYRDLVSRATAQARAVNPGLEVVSNLTTALDDVEQSPCVLYEAYKAVEDVVDGHWLNVTGNSGQVALNFLKNIEAGACVYAQ